MEFKGKLNLSLLFPGQGAQHVGMGSALIERSSVARELFAEASSLLGFDLSTLCSAGPAEQLNRTEFSQPALFVHSYAALQQLRIERPDLWDSVISVAGLSLGEYTAVAAAGGIRFQDGVRLVRIRGEAMQAAADAVESGMTSILGLDEEQVQAICRDVSSSDSFVNVANLLCPGNIAISGHSSALERAEAECLKTGALKAIRLQVAGAFHTDIMSSAVAKLQQALEDVDFHQARVPVYSNVDAEPHTAPDEIKTLLARQVVTPVRWEQTLRNMLAADTQQFIEIGAGRVLAGTLKRIDRKKPCENLGD